MKKPIQPTTTQFRRIMLEPIGGGVLLYKLDEKRVEVLEFRVDMETGAITLPNGLPMIFYDGDNEIGYRLERMP